MAGAGQGHTPIEQLGSCAHGLRGWYVRAGSIMQPAPAGCVRGPDARFSHAASCWQASDSLEAHKQRFEGRLQLAVSYAPVFFSLLFSLLHVGFSQLAAIHNTCSNAGAGRGSRAGCTCRVCFVVIPDFSISIQCTIAIFSNCAKLAHTACNCELICEPATVHEMHLFSPMLPHEIDVSGNMRKPQTQPHILGPVWNVGIQNIGIGKKNGK